MFKRTGARTIPLLLPETLLLAGTCRRLSGRRRTAGKLWRRGLAAAETQGQHAQAEAIRAAVAEMG